MTRDCAATNHADPKPGARRWPRALVCDLDGTLVDSAADVAAAANCALDEHGVDIDAAAARRWLGYGSKVLIQSAAKHYGLPADSATLARWVDGFAAAYAARPCVHTTAYPGAAQTLAALRGQGLGIAVCTNKPEHIARQVLADTGLHDVIDVLVGAGRHALKPAPDGLWAACDALDISAKQALYIGDHEADVAAARAAGLPVAIATFGYAQTPAVQLGADALFDRWSDLAGVIAALGGRHAGGLCI